MNIEKKNCRFWRFQAKRTSPLNSAHVFTYCSTGPHWFLLFFRFLHFSTLESLKTLFLMFWRLGTMLKRCGRNATRRDDGDDWDPTPQKSKFKIWPHPRPYFEFWFLQEKNMTATDDWDPTIETRRDDATTTDPTDLWVVRRLAC